MLLLLLLVTPLVNAVDDSCSTPCNCTLPEPLQPVNSTKCLTYTGTWHGLKSNLEQPCHYETFTETGSNTMGMSLTQIMENGSTHTYNGTATLGENNLVTYSFPNGFPEGWDNAYTILATDCENYTIYGHCPNGSCKAAYEIEYYNENPSSCTMKKVEDALDCLGLSLEYFFYICNFC